MDIILRTHSTVYYANNPIVGREENIPSLFAKDQKSFWSHYSDVWPFGKTLLTSAHFSSTAFCADAKQFTHAVINCGSVQSNGGLRFTEDTEGDGVWLVLWVAFLLDVKRHVIRRRYWTHSLAEVFSQIWQGIPMAKLALQIVLLKEVCLISLTELFWRRLGPLNVILICSKINRRR